MAKQKPSKAKGVGQAPVNTGPAVAPAGGGKPPPPRHLPSEPPRPSHRLLRGYAFDPSLTAALETALVGEVTYRVPWEDAEPAGRSGSTSRSSTTTRPAAASTRPVDLDHPRLLAQNGLAPSEGNPQFHQQMVYAVAMTTIDRFERALGRKAFWTDRYKVGRRSRRDRRAVRAAGCASTRTRCGWPTPTTAGTRGPSCSATSRPPTTARPTSSPAAWCSPACRTTWSRTRPRTPCSTGSTSTSWRRPTPTCWPSTRRSPTSSPCSSTSPSRRCSPTRSPRPAATCAARTCWASSPRSSATPAAHTARCGTPSASTTRRRRSGSGTSPTRPSWTGRCRSHARGAILVAAVFDAFAVDLPVGAPHDLLRLASGGTGVLPQGDLHPDLVNRLAGEAAKAAGHVLNMCIRALDYCPPVDLTFGEYLRALVTADMDLMPEDEHGYRVAFIEAFRRRGIYPDDVAHPVGGQPAVGAARRGPRPRAGADGSPAQVVHRRHRPAEARGRNPPPARPEGHLDQDARRSGGFCTRRSGAG